MKKNPVLQQMANHFLSFLNKLSRTAQKQSVILLLFFGFFLTSSAMAQQCQLYIGSGSYITQLLGTLDAPSNGQTFIAPYGKKALITFSGRATLTTSIDPQMTTYCRYFSLEPKVYVVIDGVASYLGRVYDPIGAFSTVIELSPGRHIVSMQAESKTVGGMVSGNNILAKYYSNPISIMVTEGGRPNGPVIGNVDTIFQNSDGSSTIYGWACDQSVSQSIDVHLYAGGAAGNGGTLLTSTSANIEREAAVGLTCNTSGVGHGWSFNLSPWQTQRAGQPLYIHGISRSGGTNLAIPGAGNFAIPAFPIPTITVRRTPYPMVANQSYTVTWSTTNATSVSYNCTANGTGYKGQGTLEINGSVPGVASSDWIDYPSTCIWTAHGLGGTATAQDPLNTQR